jgi:phospholipid/cholesterol/gamma-HCH transport system permease protein
MVGERFITSVGSTALAIARDTGGIVVLLGQVLRALVPPSLDGRELVRNLHKMGNRSVFIIAVTAFFVGALMAIQAGILVKRFGATGLLGWAGGYAILREVGPVLIALMFSGRVGSNNTAELGTMTVTEQLDGLRALAIHPIRYLIVPRVVAMMIALFALTVLGDLIALLGATLFSMLLFDVEFASLYFSLVDNLGPSDFLHGIIKAAAFGLVIALTSCYFGITVRGGAVGVGRAVNAAVVAAAVSILLIDFFLTYLLP